MRQKSFILTITGIIVFLLLFSGCSGNTTQTTTSSPGSGAVINSDSVITGSIKAIRQQTTGYSWEMDILIKSSKNVGDLPNPTSDKIGQVVTLKTDEDLTPYKVGQSITAKVKYTGDVPKPGISLYIYNIKAE